MTLPITIIGGYLGAGKTTLVNHLLRNADGLRLAILVNEFGELPIDEDLIEAQDDDIISIAGGCVCCSYGNDLTLALMDLAKLDPPPDHVLLESSGVALPGAIAGSVSLLQGYALDGIVVLTNAETIQDQANDSYVGDTIERQLNDADLVILNKTDLISDVERTRIKTWLSEQNGQAEIVEAQHGSLPSALILQSFATQDRAKSKRADHKSAGFETRTIKLDVPVNADQLAENLASPDLALVRAKGFVKSGDSKPKAIQVVGRRWAVSDAADTVTLGLVVIGHQSSFDEPAISDAISQAKL